MSSLICGSLAFDTITDFPGRFSEHILPDKVHMLNVAFLVPTLRREFGGCAGNIAYGMKLLGGEPRIVAALGADGLDYEVRLDRLNISREHVHVVPTAHTAQAHIITDRDNNQITAFHPGAMSHAHEQPVPTNIGAHIGIIAPDGRQAMLDHASQMAACGMPFVFDPGQGLPMFDGTELRGFIEQATWVAVNDYEAAMLVERTGWSLPEVAQRVHSVVVTKGALGCDVYEQEKHIHVPGLQAAAVVDPTGCGDAFRGGLLWALEQGWTMADACKLGNVLGACKIASAGPQNYSLNRDEALRRFQSAYGTPPAPRPMD